MPIPPISEETSKPKPPWMTISPENPNLNLGTSPVKPTLKPVFPQMPSVTPPVEPNLSGGVEKSPFRIIIPLILGLLCLGLLFLLVTKVLLPLINKKASQKPVTLTYWGLWEESELLKTTIDNYQKQNPNITINYVFQSPKDYRERLQSAFARNEGPDIFRFHNTWPAMFRKELAPVPETVFPQTEFQNTFYPVAFSDLSSQGQIYGLPLMFDSLALFYNPFLLEAAGKTVPETWDDLRKTAKEITVYDGKGKIQTAGAALGTTENVEHFSDIIGLMLLQNGADPAKPTSQLAQDALTFYTLFKTRDHVWDETLPNSIYAFATEKVAMILAPSWEAFSIKEINKNLVFKTAPAPQLSSDKKVSWATYWVEGVSAQSKNQEEAFKFLKYLSSSEVMKQFYNDASQVRAFGEPYSRQDLASEIEADPLVGSFIKQAPDAKSWYLSSRTFDNGLNDRIIKYYQDAINSLVQGESVIEISETLEAGVSQILSQYNLAN